MRFRDLQLEFPGKPHHELVFDTIKSMFKPCSYTVITTIVAFASLIISNIRPVMDFGWIMIIGLVIALGISFSFFPAALGLLKIIKAPIKGDFTRVFMSRIASLVIKAPGIITITLILLMVLSVHGILQLEVENRFIDNFKHDTEIYRGMKIIDQQLGGTTPLEIIIDPDREFIELQEELEQESSEFDVLFPAVENETTVISYWLEPDMVKKIQAVHNHLESYPTTGKVLSLATGINVIEHLNQAPLDIIELALIRKRMPEELSEIMIDPYLSDDSNQVRFNIRVKESDINLNRKNLIEGIRDYLTSRLKFTEDQVHVTGMLVLYNNMLQSLYQSQILTIGAVIIAIFLTFILLFRNLLLSSLAIIPNIFSTLLILGIMGWMNITLDMMTITIAAITIGISVDDTIHYIHRFQQEHYKNGDVPETIRKCHAGIGKAMYHTSMAIIFGFAILAMSSFIPTVHFGLLTGFAMLVALIGDLFLLPAMLLLVKPRLK